MRNLISCIILFVSIQVNAQQIPTKNRILSKDLSNIKDLQLTVTHGFTDHYFKFNITRTGETWHSAKTLVKFVKDSKDTVISRKEISSFLLASLLDCFRNPTDSIDVNLFGLERDSLIKYFDSLDYTNHIKKPGFIKRIDNPQVVHDAMAIILIPHIADHKTICTILIRYTDGSELLATSKSFADPYDLPWKVNDMKIFNPNITKIFDQICGPEELARQRKQWLYRSLVRQLSKKTSLIME